MCPVPLASRVEVRYKYTDKRGRQRYEWNAGRVVAEEGHGLQRQVHVDFDHTGLWSEGIFTHSPDMCLAAASMMATPPTFQKEVRLKAGAATAVITKTTQRHPACQPAHRSGDYGLRSEYPSARRVPLLANTGGLADDAINGTASGGSASVCAPCGDHGR